jgi:hypothetical protein
MERPLALGVDPEKPFQQLLGLRSNWEALETLTDREKRS